MPRPTDMAALRGLPNPNTTPLPNCIVDDYLPFFTGAELKVLLYLVRRTLGFHKTRDAISLSQICNGIVRKDGRRLDRGTGLHKSTACDALNALTSWGMIRRVTRRDPARGDLPTEYILWIEGDAQEESGGASEEGTIPPTAGPAEPRRNPGSRSRERSRDERAVAPVSGMSDTVSEAPPDTPLSARPDRGVSDQPDATVSGLADRQDPALQKKRTQDRSNIRGVTTQFLGVDQRSELAATAHARTPQKPGDSESVRDKDPAGNAAMAGGCSPAANSSDAPAAYDPVREELHRFAEVIAREFNDRAPFRATLSRLVNLYHRAGLSVEAFTDRLDAARQRTQERTAAIRPSVGKGVRGEVVAKNKLPYFFALFEELLGLREAPAVPAPGPARHASAVEADRLTPPARPGEGDSAANATRRMVPSVPPPTVPASAIVDDGAHMIGLVVREFSRQFADYATAVALGDWAVALWRRSGLPRQDFLDVAGATSEGLLRDHATAVSAALFQARLGAALGLPMGDDVAGVPRPPTVLARR